MPLPPAVSGCVFTAIGLCFAYNSASRTGVMETHWGYALTGITCIIVGAKFLGLPKLVALRDKTGKIDPLS
jgi:hypothetical protein